MKEKKLYRFIEIAGAVVFMIVLAVITILDNRVSYVYQTFCKVPNVVFVGIIVAGFWGLFVWQKKGTLEKKAGKKHEIHRQELVVLSVILFVLQLFVAWNIYFKTGWDCGTLVQTAQDVAYNNKLIGDDLYFSMYPNNVLLVAIFASVLRFVRLLGIQSDYFPLIILGCLLVNLAGFFLADCVRLMTKRRWLVLTAWGVFAVLCGFSAWISIPYSDTYSILFPILCIWLYCTQTTKNQYLIWGLIGFCGWVGSYIKPTVLLILLVLIAVELWHRLWNFKKDGVSVSVKRMIIWVAVTGIAVLLAMGINSLARTKMGCTPEEGRKFTPIHYLMMGLNYKTGGTYDQWDVNFSVVEQSVEARNAGDLAEIRYRLSAMGVKGFSAHLTRKLLTNFNDGTFAWGNEGEFYWHIPENNSMSAKILRSYYYEDGSAYPLFQIVSQAFWILVLCMVSCLVLKDREGTDEKKAAVVLGILAISCFVMVFEARARYLYLYAPLFILAAAMGAERVLRKK